MKRFLGLGLLIFSLMVLGACSGTDTETGEEAEDTADDDSGGSGEIDTNEEALANIPNPDPTTMDYALQTDQSGSLSAVVSKAQQGQGAPGAESAGCLCDALDAVAIQMFRRIHQNFSCMIIRAMADEEASLEAGGTLYITVEGEGISIKVTHTPEEAGEGLGTFTTFMYGDAEQRAFARFSFSDNTYEGTVKFLDEVAAELVYSISAADLTDESFMGDVSATIDNEMGNASIELTARGATRINTLTGRNEVDGAPAGAVSCQWNASLGCALLSGEGGEAEVSFAVSAASDGGKAYSDTDDDSLCNEGLPTTPSSVPAVSGFGEGETWDGVIPADATVLTFNTQTEVTTIPVGCQERGDAWDEAQPDPDSCF